MPVLVLMKFGAVIVSYYVLCGDKKMVNRIAQGQGILTLLHRGIIHCSLSLIVTRCYIFVLSLELYWVYRK